LNFAAAVLLIVSCGCSGGGGGSGGDGNGFFASSAFDLGLNDDQPLSAIESKTTVAPIYAGLGFAGVQSAKWTVGPSGPRLKSFALEIDPDSPSVAVYLDNFRRITFPLDFADSERDFASAFSGPWSSGNYNRLDILIPGESSGLEYMSYGRWRELNTVCLFGSCGSKLDSRVFYFGVETSPATLPATGQAVYTGSMRGVHSPFSQVAYSLSGSARLEVDFDETSVRGALTDIDMSSIVQGDRTTLPDIGFSAEIKGNRIVGPGVSATFFGPGGDEIGGVYRNSETIAAFGVRRE
jgi:hypothetical protein